MYSYHVSTYKPHDLLLMEELIDGDSGKKGIKATETIYTHLGLIAAYFANFL